MTIPACPRCGISDARFEGRYGPMADGTFVCFNCAGHEKQRTPEGTPDDSAICGLCGHETSLAMLQTHLVNEHDFDADELAEQIANAEIVDLTSVPPDRKGSR